MAQRLNISYVVPDDDYELSGFYLTDAKVPPFGDEFVVGLVKGVSYDLISSSWYDPFSLKIMTMFGATLAADRGSIGTYGSDYILNFVAPYTGDFVIDADWDQGSFYTEVSLGIFGDIDSLNVNTGRGVVNTFNAAPLWDRAFYLATYPDMKTIADPLAHYMDNGWREGRDPNAWFDSDGYLAANPDVRAADVNPLQHYMASGWREGRDPSVLFDTGSYLANYRDVAGAGINPLQHFLTAGLQEGRQAFGDGTWF